MQAKSLHLLPAIDECPGDRNKYLGGSILPINLSSVPLPQTLGTSVPPPQTLGTCPPVRETVFIDPRVVNAWLAAFENGDLEKSKRAKSAAFELALSSLGSALFLEDFAVAAGGVVAAGKRARLAGSVVRILDYEALIALSQVSSHT